MTKVFLGGTINSPWRKELIEMLEIDYFDPVVKTRTDTNIQEEIIEREKCDYCLYVITPGTYGYYSIAEAVDDSNKKPRGKCIFCVLEYEIPIGSEKGSDNINIPIYMTDNIPYFNGIQMKSFNEIGNLIERNGGIFFTDLTEVALYLNKTNKEIIVGDYVYCRKSTSPIIKNEIVKISTIIKDYANKTTLYCFDGYGNKQFDAELFGYYDYYNTPYQNGEYPKKPN